MYLLAIFDSKKKLVLKHVSDGHEDGDYAVRINHPEIKAEEEDWLCPQRLVAYIKEHKPKWTVHEQWYDLKVSLLKGEVKIDFIPEEKE